MTENGEEIRELTRLASELVTKIDALLGGTGDQLVGLASRAKRNRQMILMLAVSLTLDVILTAFMTFGIVRLNEVTSRVDHSLQFTQGQVLCPLYQQFINADTPAGRESALKNGQDLAKRDEAFRVIHHGYDLLNCTNEVTTP